MENDNKITQMNNLEEMSLIGNGIIHMKE